MIIPASPESTTTPQQTAARPSPPHPAGLPGQKGPGAAISAWSGGADAHLGWLLEDFVAKVAGADGALLVSRDGLALAVAGLSSDEADPAAALVSGLYSLSRGVGKIKSPSGGQVLQVVVEHDARFLFVMSALDTAPGPDPVPGGQQLAGLPRAVGCVLGVLAGRDADPGVVGYEMTTLIGSVAEHLVTATRQDQP